MQKTMSTSTATSVRTRNGKENISIARNTISSTKRKNLHRADVVEVVAAEAYPKQTLTTTDQKKSTAAPTKEAIPVVTVSVVAAKAKNQTKNHKQQHRKSDGKSRVTKTNVLYTLLGSFLFVLAGMGVKNLTSIPVADNVHATISNELLATISPSPDLFIEPSSVQSRAVTWAFSSVATASLQRYILAVLFYSLNGPSWKERRGWLSFDSECTWHGITCNAKNEVSMIWLPDNNLKGTLPHELAHLYPVDTIAVHQNKVSGPIPQVYTDLVNLRQISLYDNQMTGTIPEDLSKLDRLEYIGLQNNKFHGTIFSNIGSLKRLRTFYVHGNKLVGTLPPDITNAHSLEELAVENNSLTGSLPAKLGSLRNLRWISVQNNKFTGQIPSSMNKQTELEILYFYNNKFEGTSPDAVCESKKLREYFTDCGGTFPQVFCHCCTACCSSAGCFKEEAEKMNQAWLKKKRMGKVFVDL